jgi:hypothetical protein
LRRRTGLPLSARIFGIGLSRTGTTSLADALNVLGYRSLHFPDDPRTRKEVLVFLAAGGDSLQLSVLRRFDALTDTPICATFEALDATYPGSKFILTVREKQAWLESCRRAWEGWIAPCLRRGDPGAQYVTALHEALYGTAAFSPEAFSRAYDEYHRRVRRHFDRRPASLLTINICSGEGWDSICAFLHAPYPRTEFPWLNRAGSP